MTLPDSFWPAERKTLASILLPRLEHIAFVAGQHAATKMGISFNPTLTNKDAEQWAQDYTDTVLDELGTTTEGGVGDVLSEWIGTPGATYGDLVQSLMESGLFDQVRAARIATTETTRAYGQGEAMAYERELGVNVLFIPPAHVNCRDWLSIKRVGNQMVAVWQTNKDDLVCTQDIDTPWGTVAGCQELDGMVVSEGEYLGEVFDDLQKMAIIGTMRKGGEGSGDFGHEGRPGLVGGSGPGGGSTDGALVIPHAGGNDKRIAGMTSQRRISEIAQYAREKYAGQYDAIGVRVQESDYGEKAGNTMSHVSLNWIDGEIQSSDVGGVSSIGANVPLGGDDYSGYSGDKVLILGSNSYAHGEDNNEVIMREPKILEVIDDSGKYTPIAEAPKQEPAKVTVDTKSPWSYDEWARQRMGNDYKPIEYGYNRAGYEQYLNKLSKSADAYASPPYIRLYGKSGGVAAWIVDGQYVRDHIWIDFVMGGNPERYNFIPSGEIWLDNANEAEAGFTLLHELIETGLMAGGMSYDDAHDKANVKESEARDNPERLPELLAEQGWNA